MTPTPHSGHRTFSSWAPVQLFAALFGAVYLAVAISGFALTGFGDFLGHAHSTLIVFGVNPLHNTIHLVLAIAWLTAAPTLVWSQRVSIGIGIVFALVTVAGALGVLEFLGMMGGLADPDNLLHLATSALALYFGTLATERRGPATRRGPPRWVPGSRSVALNAPSTARQSPTVTLIRWPPTAPAWPARATRSRT